MISQEERNALADFLFATSFDNLREKPYRHIAVTASASDVGSDVHYAVSQATWERAQNEPCGTPEALLEARIDEAITQRIIPKDSQLTLCYHDYLHPDGWPIPWDVTRSHSFDRFPTLVAFQDGDRAIHGVVMRDTHTGGHGTGLRFANQNPEPTDAQSAVRVLRNLSPYSVASSQNASWYKECNIDAPSLGDAIERLPVSTSGQACIFLYMDGDWHTGLWNSVPPYDGWELTLTSMSEFYGTRCSKARLERRLGLTESFSDSDIRGTFPVLQQAALMAMQSSQFPWHRSYEHPANKLLVDWWNTHAPASMTTAASFRIYVWRNDLRHWEPGDPEEPVFDADMMRKQPSKAVFLSDTTNIIVVFFQKQKATLSGKSTEVLFADGSECMIVGADEGEYNEASYGIEGLKRFTSMLERGA